MLAEQAAGVLGIPAGSVDWHTPLPELGLDSLMAVELRARVSVALDAEISALELSRSGGLSSLASRLGDQLAAAAINPAVVRRLPRFVEKTRRHVQSLEFIAPVTLDTGRPSHLAARRERNRTGRHQNEIRDAQAVRGRNGRHDLTLDRTQPVRLLLAGSRSLGGSSTIATRRSVRSSGTDIAATRPPAISLIVASMSSG